MPVIGTRKARVYVDSTEFTDSVSTAKITTGEKDTDFVSFADAALGGAREYKFVLTLKQDTSTTSLWYYIWNEAGGEVTVDFWPNGQASVNPTTPTTTYPKFSGTVTITEPDGDLLGGDADASVNGVMVAEVEWTFTAKPTLATA